MRGETLGRFVDVLGVSTRANPHDEHTKSIEVVCTKLNLTAAISQELLQLGHFVQAMILLDRHCLPQQNQQLI